MAPPPQVVKDYEAALLTVRETLRLDNARLRMALMAVKVAEMAAQLPKRCLARKVSLARTRLPLVRALAACSMDRIYCSLTCHRLAPPSKESPPRVEQVTSALIATSIGPSIPETGLEGWILGTDFPAR